MNSSRKTNINYIPSDFNWKMTAHEELIVKYWLCRYILRQYICIHNIRIFGTERFTSYSLVKFNNTYKHNCSLMAALIYFHQPYPLKKAN